MPSRDIETVEVPETNSLLWWHPSPKEFIRTTFNATVIVLVHRLPLPRVKNFFYRMIGTEIGKNTIFDAKTDMFFPEKVKVGDNCIIAGEAKLLAHEFLQGRYRKGKIEIGDNVVIGQDSLILPGVEIGDNAIIGAGAVVTKDVDKNTVVAGNPARKIREREL